MLHFHIRKDPSKDQLYGLILPFPIHENMRSALFFKDLSPALGGSWWGLGIHGRSLGPKLLRMKCDWTVLSLLPNSGYSSSSWITKDWLGWAYPAQMMVKWKLGWTEEMDGKCLCVSCSLDSCSRHTQKNQPRRRLFSGDYSVYTSCGNTTHLNQFFLSSCSVIYSKIHWKCTNMILCD